MPRFDKTGPEGQGPMTGRRKGQCASNSDTENKNESTARPGRGLGLGRKLMGLGRKRKFRGGE